MKSTLLAAALFIAAGCISIGCVDQVDPTPVPILPSEADLEGDNASIPGITYDSCYHNVWILCCLQMMYYGAHNCYAGSVQDLYELYGDTLICPWKLEQYEVTYCSPDSFWVQCPGNPLHPSGGSGQAWPEQPQHDQDHCRSHMRSIATGEAMFFGQFNRYGTMDELIAQGFLPYLTCPGCGFDYMLEIGCETFALSCPMPVYPTHGSIVDGIASWQ